MPGGGVQDQCMFATFCDNFATAFPGGRGGDLNESKWSFSHESQDTNPAGGLIDKFGPVPSEHCMDPNNPVTFLADGDSFVCGEEFGESNHWMESIQDYGLSAMHDARILQPFDFANRTGTLDFSVDAKSTGGAGTWLEFWLTDRPDQAPHIESDNLNAHDHPRNGVGIILDDPTRCGPVASQDGNTIHTVNVFHDYTQQTVNVNGPCFATHDDTPNHFQIKIDVNHVEVWATDAGMMNSRLVGQATFAQPLNFTRGYWNLEHNQYDAKAAGDINCLCSKDNFTYHWHAISFDGPTIPTDHDYQVPDSLQPNSGGNSGPGVNLGYSQNHIAPDWQIPNVDPTGKQAWLTYNTLYGYGPAGQTLNATVNGNQIKWTDDQDLSGGSALSAWRHNTIPVPLTDLVRGTNHVTVTSPVACGNACPAIANVDLEVQQ